jgi:hypothetical protein
MSGVKQRTLKLAGAALVAVLLAGTAGAAGSGDAGQAGAFLTYGAGARSLGMGRAFVGLADDATTVFWNPGGLSGVPQNMAILQHVMLIDQNSYEFVGYTHIFPYIGTLGAGLAMLNQPSAEGRDTYDNITDSFTNQQLGFLLGFGSDLTPTLSAGGTVKLVSQSMQGSSASGFGLDLGLMYRPWPQLNLGLVFQNLLAPSIKLKDDAERYPMNMTLGVATRLLEDRFRADLDLGKNADQGQIKVRLGVEVVPIPDLFVRGGLDDTEIDLGAGYRYAGFQLDYAIGLQTVEPIHKVSLTYMFGGFVLEVNPEPPTFSPVGINKVTVLKINCQTKFEIRFWRLELRNEAGALVKKYSGEGFPPDHIVWDGLQDDTNPMPDGKYQVLFSVEDAAGESKKAPDTVVTIQSILPLGVSPVEME